MFISFTPRPRGLFVTTAGTYLDQTVVTDIRRHINEKLTKHKEGNKGGGNALDLYSEDIHFKSRPGQYHDWDLSCVYSVPSWKIWDNTYT